MNKYADYGNKFVDFSANKLRHKYYLKVLKKSARSHGGEWTQQMDAIINLFIASIVHFQPPPPNKEGGNKRDE
jgi:hypothetical protein